MKIMLLILFTIIFGQLTYGQIDINNYGGCFVIQFINRKFVVPDTAMLPVDQEHGFQIIENGVYDFVIDGKKYFQALLLSILGLRTTKLGFVNYNEQKGYNEGKTFKKLCICF